VYSSGSSGYGLDDNSESVGQMADKDTVAGRLKGLKWGLVLGMRLKLRLRLGVGSLSPQK